ncbi:hypothetical protein [Photorhabdus antumapuensis]|uniref:hypothetical protein n=1 Tax=Photorhabdus antumapuensis TaxID=2862867 RepID=UPI001CEDD7DB|nr:hypothetical protein [Photorhabdus antumapuensis]MCA6219308.1 hypothetical protein [Photorhabdus antumapuensis]
MQYQLIRCYIVKRDRQFLLQGSQILRKNDTLFHDQPSKWMFQQNEYSYLILAQLTLLWSVHHITA